MAEAAFVAKALSSKEEDSRGQKVLYDGLVQQLESTQSDDANEEELAVKARVLAALAKEAPRLVAKKAHAALLSAVFKAAPRRDTQIGALGALLASLVSTKSTLVGRAFATLFRIASNDIDAAAIEAVVEAVVAVLDICPRGTSQLFDAARRAYPWFGEPTAVHAAYVRVLLGVARRQPLAAPTFLDLLVSRAIEIDVHTSAADDDDEDPRQQVSDDRRRVTVSSAADDDQDDQDDDDDDDRGNVEEDENAPNTTAVVRRSKSTSQQQVFELDLETSIPPDQEEENAPLRKLDAVMCLLFEYAEERLEDETLFAAALEIFEASVLHTHECRFVQFFFFKLATTTRDRATRFAARLIDVAAYDTAPRVTRLSAVAYLASFLCRALVVDARLATDCCDHVFRWAERAADLVFSAAARRLHVDDDENIAHSFRSLATSPNSLKNYDLEDDLVQNEHRRRRQDTQDDDDKRRRSSEAVENLGLFAAMFQALLYVVCFRGDELLAEASSLRDSARWRRLVTVGNAEGLKRCDARVRLEFLDACDRARLFPDDLLATLRGVRGASLPPRRDHDFFFPFDPYHLPNSRAFVATGYRSWTQEDDAGVLSEDDDDDDHAGSVGGEHDPDDDEPPFAASDSQGHASRSPSVMSLDGGGGPSSLRARVDSVGRLDEEGW